MNKNFVRSRGLVITLIFLVGAAALITSCAGPQASQGGTSRIPDTSMKPTATMAANTLPSTMQPKIASPSPVLLPSESIEQPTQPPSLYAAPTDTPQPTATFTPEVMKVDPACLVGTWQVADLPGAMSQSYAQSGATIQLQSVQGQETYAFDPNGSMTISVSRLAATFTGVVDNQNVTVLQGLDGSGTAHYEVSPGEGQMVLSDFGGQGLLSTLDINGQRIAEGNIPVWQAFTSSLSTDTNAPNALVNYSRVSVTCQGDSMTIQAVEPVSGPPVRLSREK